VPAAAPAAVAQRGGGGGRRGHGGGGHRRHAGARLCSWPAWARGARDSNTARRWSEAVLECLYRPDGWPWACVLCVQPAARESNPESKNGSRLDCIVGPN
jgi:hypothetical protein